MLRPCTAGSNPKSPSDLVQFLDIVALPDSALQDAAKHPPSPSDFLPQPRTQFIHLTAWRTDHGHFEKRFADSEGLPDLVAIDVKSVILAAWA